MFVVTSGGHFPLEFLQKMSLQPQKELAPMAPKVAAIVRVFLVGGVGMGGPPGPADALAPTHQRAILEWIDPPS